MSPIHTGPVEAELAIVAEGSRFRGVDASNPGKVVIPFTRGRGGGGGVGGSERRS